MSNTRKILAASALVALTALPAEAQTYRWDIGVNGGYSWYSQLVDRDAAAWQSDARFRDGWLVGAQFGLWPTERLGLRANATFSDRPVWGIPATQIAGQERRNLVEHVNLWSGSGDVLFRMRSPNAAWNGTEWLPYVALGLGAKWINPAGDRHTLAVNQTQRSGEAFQTGQDNGIAVGMNQGWFGIPEQRVLMGLVGLGTDVRLAPNFAVRLELNDRIYRPQLYTTMAGASANQFTAMNQSESVGRTVHEISGQIGLHLLGGLRPAPVVAVAPAPPPPAAPPAPAPAPAPREDAVMVCVVDPAAPTGLRMQEAVFRHATRDTVVMQGGQAHPLAHTVGTVPVTRDADWFVRGQPLTVTVGTQRLEYVTYETPRLIEAERLAYLGRVNGMPVYADRDQVQRVSPRLTTARQARADHDLAMMLAGDRELRDAIADVRVLYVPTATTGCVFQGVVRQEDIRK
jgi:hypothetical protein